MQRNKIDAYCSRLAEKAFPETNALVYIENPDTPEERWVIRRDGAPELLIGKSWRDSKQVLLTLVKSRNSALEA